jgi:S-layer protein (TIGR01567 family)
MRKKPILFILAAIVLLACVVGFADSLEIRSQVTPVKNGTYIFASSSSGVGSSSTMSIGFNGFFYDIDEDLGTEKLIVNIINGNRIDGFSSPPGLIYETANESKRFEFRDWGRYSTLGFMGQNYFVGYNSIPINGNEPYLFRASEHKNVLDSQILLKVLIDSDSTRLFSGKMPLKLKEGYELELRSVDLTSKKANVRLIKDGTIEQESVVVCEPNADMIDRTFIYKKNIKNVKNLTIIAIHFDRLFIGDLYDNETQKAQVDGIFQLSEYPTAVNEGTRYGVMTVTDVGARTIGDANNRTIQMTNRDKTIFLDTGKEVNIFGDIRLRTADKIIVENEPLNFYIYSNITEPGIYDVRGPRDQILGGRTYHWSFADFPGFMYDLDSNLGTENFSMNLLGSSKSGDARLDSLVYETKAKQNEFKFGDWGAYHEIGFMGEKYFSGYVKNDSKLSIARMSGRTTNLLAYDMISKVLIDSDTELPPISNGSVFALEDGYKLRIREIDSNKVVLELIDQELKVLDSNKIVTPGNGEGSTYYYKASMDKNGQNSFLTIAVHFRNAYKEAGLSLTTIDGVWQISDKFKLIQDNPDLGIMKVKEINPTEGNMLISMNSDGKNIRVTEGATKKIMGDYYIRFADQDDGKAIRFYIMKNVTVGGGDEIYSLPNPLSPYESGMPKDDNGADRVSPDYSISLALAVLFCAVCLIKRNAI